MKKFKLLFLSIFAIGSIYSQTYLITFSATGAATTLDSVLVENLSQNTYVMCNAGDVLELVLITGINEKGLNEESLKIFPNPMQEFTEISFFAEQTGIATLSICDISGKVVLKSEEKLLQGNHTYRLTGLQRGVYLISIIGKGYFYTSTIISQNVTAVESKIKHIGNGKPETVSNNQKSTKAIVSMDYITGDSLRFTGYSGSLVDIVYDVPTSSKTITFTFIICGQAITDFRDGNVYQTVLVNDQCWLAENLKYLPSVVGPGTGSETAAYYYVYGYDGTDVTAAKATPNYAIYGVLYNWPAAMSGYTGSSATPGFVQGVCPTGWHLPGDAEWTQLTQSLGGEIVAGGKLKETGYTHWSYPNTGATNETGFTALPGGQRDGYGTFDLIGGHGTWWSATGFSPNSSWDRTMTYYDGQVWRSNSNNEGGFSVRCVGD